LSFGLFAKQPTDKLWYGDLPNKGVGIFTYNDFKIKLLDIHNPVFKYVLPLKVYNDKISFTIFAVWAQKPEKNDNYIEQVWNAVHFYGDLLDGENIILAGDFNSNTIFDKPERECSHTCFVSYLKTKNIVSAYHQFHNQIQGKEMVNTHFLQRKKDKAFHLDYIFISENLVDKLKDVEIDDYETWTKHSDHQPITMTLDL